MKIKQIARNIFFKVFLGVLLLSFAFFGVSSFLLGGSNTWVAKVGGKSISYNKFIKAVQADRETILKSNPNNAQAQQYVDSDQFKSEVLGRLVNSVIIEKLRDHYGVEASKQIILEAVAKDPNFNKDGKFDREAFRRFLAQNGFDEDRYIRAVQDEIIGTMIITSISMSSPVDNKIVSQISDIKAEKRIADIVIVNDKNVPALSEPKEKDLEEFYKKHKQKLTKPETRKVSYITIAKKDFSKISEDELQKKISTIQDSLLSSNSIEETIAKNNIKSTIKSIEINQNGMDEKGAVDPSIKALDGFAANVFAAKENQTSKLFYSQTNAVFYALKVEKIDAARERKFDEVKMLINNLYQKEQKTTKLKEFADKIAEQINQNPQDLAQIIAKNGLKIEKNKEFPRFYYISFQGQTIPYSSQFNEELFGIKSGQATNANATNANEFKIGILRDIKKTVVSAAQIQAAKLDLAKEYRSEILQEFNNFLQKKFPIRVNEKLLNKKE